jgi:hypothetical protein
MEVLAWTGGQRWSYSKTSEGNTNLEKGQFQVSRANSKFIAEWSGMLSKAQSRQRGKNRIGLIGN